MSTMLCAGTSEAAAVPRDLPVAMHGGMTLWQGVTRLLAAAGTDSSTSPQELAQDPELDAFYDRQAQLERPAAVTVAATILHTAR